MARLKNVVTLEEKKSLVVLAKKDGITLDGKPAMLVGVRNKFPSVAETANSGKAFEFSWKAVREVMYNKQGRFNS